MPNDPMDRLKQFVMNNQLAEHELNRVENEFGIDLGRSYGADSGDGDYYPQIEAEFRADAASMSKHYEVFYSLERTIRQLITDTLEASDGIDWWEGERVPQTVKSAAERLRKREIDSGTSLRSDDPLDFCTFGELSEIIKANWDVFGGMLSSVAAVEKVMSRLNSLRGPIAHCSLLAEDEVLRLRLTVRDWFRLME